MIRQLGCKILYEISLAIVYKLFAARYIFSDSFRYIFFKGISFKGSTIYKVA